MGFPAQLVARLGIGAGVGACAALATSCGGKSVSDAAPSTPSECGAGGVSHPASYGGGSRLKPRVYDAGCGAEQHSGTWFDTELGESCEFMMTEDGMERCVPPRFYADLYLDAGCTVPVAGHTQCTGPLPHFAVAPFDYLPLSCASSRRVYRVGEPLAADVRIFSGSPGACSASEAAEGVTYHALERVAPETFVSARRSQRERTALLAAETLEAEDGSWRITGFFDPARGSACAGSQSWEPRGRCVAPHTSPPTPPDRFSDPECKVGVAFVRPCQELPRVWFERVAYSGATCQARDYYDLYEVDGLVETTYVGTPDDCSVGGGPTIPPDAMGLRRGAPIDPGSLPAVEQLDVGSGRVRARFWGAEGVPFYPTGFSEAETGTECYLRSFADGATRCVPSSWPFGSYAASSDCSGIVAGVRGCEPEPPGILLAEETLGCPQVLTGATTAVPHDGGIYRPDHSSGAVCLPFLRSTLGDLARFYQAGAKLNPAQLFGEVKLVERD